MSQLAAAHWWMDRCRLAAAGQLQSETKMNTTQAQFNFSNSTERDAAIASVAEWLVNYLQGRRWVISRQILAALNLSPTEDNKRWLRRVREATNGRVLGGPGMPGYMLLNEMSVEEFRHWRETMRSQAREMDQQIILAEKRYHAVAA